eukprot:g532.t1
MHHQVCSVESLCRAALNGGITSIDLSSNCLGATGARVVAEMLRRQRQQQQQQQQQQQGQTAVQEVGLEDNNVCGRIAERLAAEFEDAARF